MRRHFFLVPKLLLTPREEPALAHHLREGMNAQCDLSGKQQDLKEDCSQGPSKGVKEHLCPSPSIYTVTMKKSGVRAWRRTSLLSL